MEHVYLEDESDGIGQAEVMVCLTHNEVAIMYEDLSVGCRYDAITETSNEHHLVPVLQYQERQKRHKLLKEEEHQQHQAEDIWGIDIGGEGI